MSAILAGDKDWLWYLNNRKATYLASAGKSPQVVRIAFGRVRIQQRDQMLTALTFIDGQVIFF